MGNTYDDLGTIQLSQKPKLTIEESEHIPSVQSANVLFKFIDKIEYLKHILKNKAMIPRYYEEMIDYLELKDLKKIALPMSCFCDIHLNKLVPHMKYYGKYGIGLNKVWGINHGVQPIHYINPHSGLIDDFRFVFIKSLEESDESNKIISDYCNYILTHLIFMKPLEGLMFRNGKYENRNFHDEREWRFVPYVNRLNTELPLIIPQEHMNPDVIKLYSDGIIQCQDLWLNFEYEDIKYLIVEDENDRQDLINFIISNIGETEMDKFTLIAKILVFNNLKEDW